MCVCVFSVMGNSTKKRPRPTSKPPPVSSFDHDDAPFEGAVPSDDEPHASVAESDRFVPSFLPKPLRLPKTKTKLLLFLIVFWFGYIGFAGEGPEGPAAIIEPGTNEIRPKVRQRAYRPNLPPSKKQKVTATASIEPPGAKGFRPRVRQTAIRPNRPPPTEPRVTATASIEPPGANKIRPKVRQTAYRPNRPKRRPSVSDSESDSDSASSSSSDSESESSRLKSVRARQTAIRPNRPPPTEPRVTATASIEPPGANKIRPKVRQTAYRPNRPKRRPSVSDSESDSDSASSSSSDSESESSRLKSENRRLRAKVEELTRENKSKSKPCEVCASLFQAPGHGQGQVVQAGSPKPTMSVLKETDSVAARIDHLLSTVTLPACTYDKGDCCTSQQCTRNYTPAHVSRLRSACLSNTKDDQRVWMLNRLQKKKVRNRNRSPNSDVGSTNSPSLRNHAFFLESPKYIEEQRNKTSVQTLSSIGKPVLENLQQVCSKFFHFVTKKSTNFLYAKNKIDGEFSLIKHTMPRIKLSPQEVQCELWFKEQAKYALMLPKPPTAKDTLILPFTSKEHTYRMFCQDMTTSDSNVDIRRSNGIPSYSTFLRTWSTKFNHLKSRRWIPFAKCTI